MNRARRALLASLGACLGAVAGAQPRNLDASRVTLLARLRALDLTPAWFTSANWANRLYDPWTDYISGEMSEADFSVACANVSDYCLRDIWNLRKKDVDPIDWEKYAPTWNGIHALALRYFRTGRGVYLRKWVAVVDDYIKWTVRMAEADRLPTRSAMPAPLLDAAFTWGGLFTAVSIIAKALGRDVPPADPRQSPYAPVIEPLDAGRAAELPEVFLERIGAAFARAIAPDLLKAYQQPRYVPNQRMFGTEAVALASAMYPGQEALVRLRPTLDASLTDIATRYRHVDGGQLEQSFNYARDVIDGLTRVQKLPLSPVPPWRKAAADTIEAWQRFTQAIALPEGGLPQVGNAASGRVSTEGHLRFGATSMAFPYSGMYCQRSDWARDAAYLFFFVRRAARGHSMAGSNSLQVQAFGTPLLVPGGSADYRPVNELTRGSATYLSELSSWKTNTILVDLESQAGGDTEGLSTDSTGEPDILRVPPKPIHSRWLASDAFDFMEGVHRSGYGKDKRKEPLIRDVQHQRQIVFVRALKVWVVIDRLVTGATHRYHQVWKFAPPQGLAGATGFGRDQVTIDREERRIRTTRLDAPNIALHHFGVADLEYESHFGDQFGWFSPGPTSNAVPAVDVHAVWHGGGPQTLLTMIVPYRGSKSPLDRISERSAGDDIHLQAEFGGGRQLVIRVPVARPGAAAESGRLELLVSLNSPGSAGAKLRITAGGGEEEVGPRTRQCVFPVGMVWKTDGSTLTPSYTR